MEVEVAQSAVLDEAEVAQTLEESGETQEVSLPSDEEQFEIPEKFKGKSAEDIIKSYLELEKMKSKPEEVVTEDAEEDDTEVDEDAPEFEHYQKYAESFDANGGLSEQEYAELAEMGYSREVVDAEIEAREDLKAYHQYKVDKALNDVLEPLGGGKEKFKEVSDWANSTKSPEEVAAFNEALAAAPKLAQQALLKTLYAEYESSGTTDTVLHTNTPQSTTSRGYATESEFFADMNNPAYKTDKSYVKAVEAKLARSNTKDWSF